MTNSQALIYDSLVFDHADFDRDLMPYHGPSKRPISESVMAMRPHYEGIYHAYSNQADFLNNSGVYPTLRGESSTPKTNCRNCGANSTKNGRCDYCGSDR